MFNVVHEPFLLALLEQVACEQYVKPAQTAYWEEVNPDRRTTRSIPVFYDSFPFCTDLSTLNARGIGRQNLQTKIPQPSPAPFTSCTFKMVAAGTSNVLAHPNVVRHVPPRLGSPSTSNASLHPLNTYRIRSSPLTTHRTILLCPTRIFHPNTRRPPLPIDRKLPRRRILSGKCNR
jgi:hypothetical protein